MSLVLSCPSKTFLLGEYLVLNDGAALTIHTKPRFELRVDMNGSGQMRGISAESPAGQWVQQNKSLFEKVDIEFHDPYAGVGGFGASSAQYLLTNIMTQVLLDPDKHDDFKIEQIWRAYRQLEFVSSEGLRPSGADLVGQFMGALCSFQPKPFEAYSFRWPFEDEDVVFVHTGKKVTTHEHLRGLKRVETDELKWIYERAMQTMAVGDASAFFDSVNDYYAELLELGLVASHTQVIVASLMTKPFVRAAKGCGAMGSDVVAVFASKQNRAALDKELAKLDMQVISDLSQIDRGFEIE